MFSLVHGFSLVEDGPLRAKHRVVVVWWLLERVLGLGFFCFWVFLFLFFFCFLGVLGFGLLGI